MEGIQAALVGNVAKLRISGGKLDNNIDVSSRCTLELSTNASSFGLESVTYSLAFAPESVSENESQP